MVFIYSLSSSSCPENVRYIGKAKNLKDRLRRHIGKHYLNNEINYKNNWIKSEILKGNTIIIKELDVVSEEDWQEKEKYWISYHIEKGYQLTNTTEGGDGIILTDEIIKKRNESNIKRNSERINLRIERYNIRKEDEFWIGERKCECGNVVVYKNLLKKVVLGYTLRAEKEKRICNSCKSSGKRNYFYGLKLNDGKLKQEKYGKKILQFDSEGNQINEFKSIREASEITGIDRKSISCCVNGKNHYNTAGGFKFKIKQL